MSNLILFNSGEALKAKFRASLALLDDVTEEVVEPNKTFVDESPKTVGEWLYNNYRAERIKQGWEEFKWSSLMTAQQLVWERLAEGIGLRMQ